MSKPTVRGGILGDARKATEGDRNKSYGDPSVQLGLAGELKALVRGRMKREVGPAEMEALDMVLTKLSRAVIGSEPGRDTYVDGAAYFAIAGECALQTATKVVRTIQRDAAAHETAMKTSARVYEAARERQDRAHGLTGELSPRDAERRANFYRFQNARLHPSPMATYGDSA